MCRKLVPLMAGGSIVDVSLKKKRKLAVKSAFFREFAEMFAYSTGDSVP